jgi:hypothetical protein
MRSVLLEQDHYQEFTTFLPFPTFLLSFLSYLHLFRSLLEGLIHNSTFHSKHFLGKQCPKATRQQFNIADAHLVFFHQTISLCPSNTRLYQLCKEACNHRACPSQVTPQAAQYNLFHTTNHPYPSPLQSQFVHHQVPGHPTKTKSSCKHAHKA